MKESKLVWIASDNDREGEAIAHHLKTQLKLKKYHRITFSEITPKALEYAIRHPRAIDENLVSAQEGRRILDRLVGFKITPILWNTFEKQEKGLSAGRVQSAALHMVLIKEKSITDFVPKDSFWNFSGTFEKLPVKSALYIKDKEAKTTEKCEVSKTLNLLKDAKFYIKSLSATKSSIEPDVPFMTSTLQQAANTQLKFSSKDTMQYAQDLYERGHITYMRTDSITLCDSFKELAATYITATYGQEYLQKKEKGKKDVEGAHEGIRPTALDNADLSDLSRAHKSLYNLIFKRTLVALMAPARQTTNHIHIAPREIIQDYVFRASIPEIDFLGWKIIYEQQDETVKLPKLKENQDIICKEITAVQHPDTPPARYTEASFIKSLEKKGIGRPSTFASIIDKLFTREYVILKDQPGISQEMKTFVGKPNVSMIEEITSNVNVGSEKRRLSPTPIGVEIDEFISKQFEYIADSEFTSRMEKNLDLIASGEQNQLDMLKKFWDTFSKDLTKHATPYNKSTNNIMYTINGREYIIREAKFGPVIQFMTSKTSYINLKPYIQFKKYSDYKEVTRSDVKLLIKLPLPIPIMPRLSLVYGPYGFYAKDFQQEKNYKLTEKVARSILDNTVTKEDLKF